MRICELSSLAALIFVCGIYQNEAFVNTIASSSSTRQNLFDDASNAGLRTPSHRQRSDITSRKVYRNRGHDGAMQGRGRGGRKRRGKFDRKPRNDLANNKENQERLRWLRQATDEILGKEVGSLNKGKWHELVSMMKGWSKFAKIDAESPVLIERLIKRLHDERLAGNEEAMANIRMYNALLDSWCCVALFATNFQKNRRNNDNSVLESTRIAASQRAREILVLLQENYERTKADNNPYAIRPDEESFGLVFDVVLKIEGVAAARRLLAWMEYVSKSGKNDLAKPSRKFYMRLLNSYANSRDENAGLLAEAILRHMVKIGEMPDTVCYNIAIKAWTKGGLFLFVSFCVHTQRQG